MQPPYIGMRSMLQPGIEDAEYTIRNTVKDIRLLCTELYKLSHYNRLLVLESL